MEEESCTIHLVSVYLRQELSLNSYLMIVIEQFSVFWYISYSIIGTKQNRLLPQYQVC